MKEAQSIQSTEYSDSQPLQVFSETMSEALQQVDVRLETTALLLESVKTYQDNAIDPIIMKETGFQDNELALIQTAGAFVLGFDEVARPPKNLMFDADLLKKFTFHFTTRYGNEAVVREAFNTIVQLGNDSPTQPLLHQDTITQLGRSIPEFIELTKNPLSQASVETLHEIAVLMQRIPTKATIEVLAGCAYVPVLQALQQERTVGMLGNDSRQEFLRRGCSLDDINVMDATHILKNFALGKNENLDDAVFMVGLLSHTAGLNFVTKLNISADKDGSLVPRKRLPERAKLLLQAYTMLNSVSKLYAATSQGTQDLLHNPKVVRDNLRMNLSDQCSDFSETWDGFYEAVGPRVINNTDGDQFNQEAFVVESHISQTAQTLIRYIGNIGILHRDTLRSLHENFQPRFMRHLQEKAAVHQFTENQKTVAEVAQHLTLISKPYQYSAKAIRKFQKGLDYLRNLDQDLAAQDIKIERNSLQMLALLVLQSEHVSSKEDYFEALHSAMHDAQALTKKIEAFGSSAKDSNTSLAALQEWIEQTCGNSRPVPVRNSRLQQFLDHYLSTPKRFGDFNSSF